MIAGVSLGDARVVRLSRDEARATFDVLLESGSVYVQRCGRIPQIRIYSNSFAEMMSGTDGSTRYPTSLTSGVAP
jgi:hypothetical protein